MWVLLWIGVLRKTITASDVVYESDRGSTGVLAVGDPDKPEVTRLGRVIVLPGHLSSILGARATYIAQLELLTVLVATTEVAGLFMTEVQRYIDNVEALIKLEEGLNGSRSLDKIAEIIHLACFATCSIPYSSMLNRERTG